MERLDKPNNKLGQNSAQILHRSGNRHKQMFFYHKESKSLSPSDIYFQYAIIFTHLLG